MFRSVPTKSDIIEEETLTATIVTANRLERDAQLPEAQGLKTSKRSVELRENENSCFELKANGSRAKYQAVSSNLRLKMTVLPLMMTDTRKGRIRIGKFYLRICLNFW